eukprot:965573-Pelagomonas_calceolata.AAC.1
MHGVLGCAACCFLRAGAAGQAHPLSGLGHPQQTARAVQSPPRPLSAAFRALVRWGACLMHIQHWPQVQFHPQPLSAALSASAGLANFIYDISHKFPGNELQKMCSMSVLTWPALCTGYDLRRNRAGLARENG